MTHVDRDTTYLIFEPDIASLRSCYRERSPLWGEKSRRGIDHIACRSDSSAGCFNSGGMFMEQGRSLRVMASAGRTTPFIESSGISFTCACDASPIEPHGTCD